MFIVKQSLDKWSSRFLQINIPWINNGTFWNLAENNMVEWAISRLYTNEF